MTGFDLYNETSEEIKRKLIGKKRNDGLEIKNYSVHFIDRILGQTAEPHSRMRTGVAIDKALNAFKNGTVDNKKSTETSVKISDGNVVVTINPKTGNLIQTNRKKK